MTGWGGHRCRAALVALVLVAGGCGDDGDGEGAQGTSTSTTGAGATTTSAPATAIDYSRPTAPRPAGTGFLMETSLDGSALYVEEEDPAFPEPGCEGQPEPVGFRLPLDGGDRELLGTKEEPVNGNLVRSRGGTAPRQVAVVQGCEEFLVSVRVGTETADGRLRDLKPVDLPEEDEPSLAGNMVVSSWSADGRSLMVAGNNVGMEDAPTPVGTLDPTTGRVSRLFDVTGGGGLSQVAELGDGTIVTAGAGTVALRARDGTVARSVPGFGFAVAPDGSQVVVYGEALVLLAPDLPGPVTLVPDEEGPQVTSAVFSPDGRAVAYVKSVADDNQVAVLTVAGKKSVPVGGPGQFGRVFFTGDGQALVFNQFEGEPDYGANVLLARFGA